LGILVVVALAVVAAFIRPVEEGTPGFQAGYRIGGLSASLLIPGVIAYAIAGRKKARNPNLLALVFCVSCVLLLVTSFAGALNSESADQRISRLMREAAGLQPVRQSMFPSDRRWDDGVREILRDLMRQNKDYHEAYSKIDQNQISKINTPESFADSRVAAPALQQLHASYDLDVQNEARVKGAVEKLRIAMESGVSSSEREAVERGLAQGLAAQMPKRRRLVEAERQWLDAVDSEYTYAQQHEKDFRFSQGHLGVAEAAVREEFNARVREQEARRKELLNAKKEFEQYQAQTLQKMGLSAKDAGVQ
jgi:hypothetical protein